MSIAILSGMQIEGNLIASDIATEMLSGTTKGQLPENFNFAKTDKLADEIAIAWGDAKAYWAAFQRAAARLPDGDLATTVTREQWVVPLLRSLGYDLVYTAKAEIVDGQTYALSHRSDPGEDKPPIHVVGCRVKLEQRPPSGNPRLSAHALMQEFLNRTEHLWGIVTNGLQWRLLRDSSLMTRLTYIEFDLEQILSGDNFAEFGLFYRLFHRSRLPQGIDDTDACLLEYYHQQAIQQGGRVRDRLRDGVEKALVLLGTGFLQHPANEKLRQSFESGELLDTVYYRQLLMLIYRLLFLMVAEARKLLLTESAPEKDRIYLEYYSVTRLRNLAERPSYRREGFQDLWQGLRVTFQLFDENWRGKVLGISPLNGDLFGSKTLTHLDEYAIDNHELLSAIRQLSLYEQKGQLRLVNYAALDVEELGSVYESLLDFHPQVVQRQGIYEFQLVTGSDRKTTGSYYTPPELVGQLIKSALEPVIADKLQGLKTLPEQEAALLGLRVCDPACGSGHFLLAAARRIGKELAICRTGEAQPAPEPLRKAIRDVVQNCIYGVDLNPLAVDLCKVALWIEGFNRGMPLNFLDHRIKCGNSLVGVLDLDCLKEGIPDAAYKAVTGDDKSLSSKYRKQNKQERENEQNTMGRQLSFFEQWDEERSHYAQTAIDVGAIAEFTTDNVKQKQDKYQQSRQDSKWWRDYCACNLWTAAFFMTLTEQNLQLLPTTAALTQLLRGNTSTQKIVEAANKLAQEKHFFHWALEFPEVFETDGFDCVLGNPPWERIKLQEKEFFGSRSLEIANAANKAEREKLIKRLVNTNPRLAQSFQEAKHDAEAQSKFIRESGRFLLTAVGDINTYAIFTETNWLITENKGCTGCIVPPGIATDEPLKGFIQHLINERSITSFFDFTNRGHIFPGIESTLSFSLLTLAKSTSEEISLAAQLWKIDDLKRSGRIYNLSFDDIYRLNPNTLNLPILKSEKDARLIKQIYNQVPILIKENIPDINLWNITLSTMFHMSSDVLPFFKTKNQFEKEQCIYVPLYESKLLDIFNHRANTFSGIGEENMYGTRPRTNKASLDQLKDPDLTILPRYWVPKEETEARIPEFWKHQWLIGFRNAISAVADSRTARFSFIPRVGTGNSIRLVFPNKKCAEICALVANFNSLIFDYITKQKASGGNFSFYILRQLPVIPPEAYTEKDIKFISDRVLELVYTAWDMQPFAQDMGYDGEPFIWNPNRRALLRAELDAYYAKLYGLTRDELRYILDPADVYGADFPSETFRVLKNNEIKQFGEYLTQRLVLEAWDKMFAS